MEAFPVRGKTPAGVLCFVYLWWDLFHLSWVIKGMVFLSSRDAQNSNTSETFMWQFDSSYNKYLEKASSGHAASDSTPSDNVLLQFLWLLCNWCLRGAIMEDIKQDSVAPSPPTCTYTSTSTLHAVSKEPVLASHPNLTNIHHTTASPVCHKSKEHFMTHLPHAQRWYVPFFWRPLRWLYEPRDRPALRLRCSRSSLRPSTSPDDPKTCSTHMGATLHVTKV